MWGSRHPSSKERQETALGKRKRKRLGSGSGHGVWPGGAAGEDKKAWLRAELAPGPPASPLPWALNPDGPPHASLPALTHAHQVEGARWGGPARHGRSGSLAVQSQPQASELCALCASHLTSPRFPFLALKTGP